MRMGRRRFSSAPITLSRDAEIAAHWGEALWKSGHKQQARSVWTDALAMNPDSKALKAVLDRFAPPDKP